MAKQTDNQVSAVRRAKHGWILTLFFSILAVSDFFGADQLVKEKRIYYEKSFCTSG